MKELNQQEMRHVASVANEDGRVRCEECGESKELRSDGRAVRHLGAVRFWLVCKNGHALYMQCSEEAARQLRLPIPTYRRTHPRGPGGTAPRA